MAVTAADVARSALAAVTTEPVNLPLAAGRAIQVYVNAAQIRARARLARDRKRS